MPTSDGLSFSFDEFSGTARLFPLPNLVLFPYVMQPLHVFEPRYRAMLEDALAGDHLIAMAVLEPGWEHDYEGRPPVHPMACLGRIMAHSRRPDGTYNILLFGLRRVRILFELPPHRRFREARVEVCDDYYPAQTVPQRQKLQQELRRRLIHFLPQLPQAGENIDHLLDTDVPLGMLCDVIGYMLNVDLAEKQTLLAETDVYRRAELLLTHLAGSAADLAPSEANVLCYPPQFSAN